MNPQDFIKQLDEINLPQDLSSRSVKGITLAEKEKQNKKGRAHVKKAAVAACIATTLLISYQIPSVKAALNQVVQYFAEKQDSKYIHEQDIIEQTAVNVGQSAEYGGITFSVDSISMDEAYLNIFYTIQSQEAIAKNDSNHWAAEFTAPFLRLKINGQEVFKTHGALENEAYFTDDYTLKGLDRISVAVIDLEEDQWQVEIGADRIFDTEGQWLITMAVDKNQSSAARVVKPDITFTVEEAYMDVLYKIPVTIEKVAISPFGNSIVLRQHAIDFTPEDPFDTPPAFRSFALFDENGQSLHVIDKGFSQNGDGSAVNEFEFLSARQDIKEITLIPYTSKESALETIDKDLSTLPIEFAVNDSAKVIVTGVAISAEEIRVDYYYDGVIPFNADFRFLDHNGEQIYAGGYLEHVYDRATGLCTAVFTNKDTEKFNHVSLQTLEKIAQIRMYTMEEILLLDELAVTIPLP